jgi:hypothetical protein
MTHDEHDKKAQVMRCLGCGAEMILLKVVPDTNMMVTGYEHHTLQCSGCYEVEQRLIFSLRNEPPPDDKRPDRLAAEAPAAAPPPPPPAEASPPGAFVANGGATEVRAPARAASAWTRAVDKVRMQQADLKERLHARAESARKIIAFNQDWESLAVPQSSAPAPEQSRSTNSGEEHGADAAPAPVADGAPAPDAAAREGAPMAEKIDLSQGFNRVWEKLLPRGAARRVEGGGSRSDQPPAS